MVSGRFGGRSQWTRGGGRRMLRVGVGGFTIVSWSREEEREESDDSDGTRRIEVRCDGRFMRGEKGGWRWSRRGSGRLKKQKMWQRVGECGRVTWEADNWAGDAKVIWTVFGWSGREGSDRCMRRREKRTSHPSSRTIPGDAGRTNIWRLVPKQSNGRGTLRLLSYSSTYPSQHSSRTLTSIKRCVSFPVAAVVSQRWLQFSPLGTRHKLLSPNLSVVSGPSGCGYENGAIRPARAMALPLRFTRGPNRLVVSFLGGEGVETEQVEIGKRAGGCRWKVRGLGSS